MNKKVKSKSTLITIMIVLFIIMLSAKNSHAIPQMKQLVKIINHKIITEKMGVGAAVVLIDEDEIALQNFGFSDLENQEKVNDKTLFEIGSISKTFTSTALASMVSEGKVKLSDPVQQYLPTTVTLPIKNNKPITLLSLANHSSGLPRLPSNMSMADPLDPYADYTTKLMYEFLNEHTLQHEVETHQEYSNLGYGLLGHVLSLIDKKPYEQVINDRVLKPLKMNSTFVDVPKTHQHHLSNGHNAQLEKTKLWDLNTLAGAGALKANIKDMALYLLANVTHQTLANEFRLTQASTSINKKGDTHISLAWIHNQTENKNLLMHDGGTGGFRSFIGFDINNKKGIVILANTVFDMNEIGFHYLNNSLDTIKLVAPKNINLTAEQLSKLNGQFELVPGFILSITHENEQLYVQATGQQKFPLTAVSNTEFINNAVKVKIDFEVDSQNTALSLTLYQAGQTLLGVKL
jgi:CubicO group peptidase (beta-lactamase class C family)